MKAFRPRSIEPLTGDQVVFRCLRLGIRGTDPQFDAVYNLILERARSGLPHSERDIMDMIRGPQHPPK